MTTRLDLLALPYALMCLAAAPALPDASRPLPESLRDRATVVVSGTYALRRGPCQWLPDGSRRWRSLAGFVTQTVYRGEVRAPFIGVEHPGPEGTWDEQLTLVPGRRYLLLVRPSGDSEGWLRGRSPAGGDVLSRSEILAILEHDVGEGREIVLSEQVEQLLDEAEGRVPVALHGHAQMYFLHRADEGFESRLALLREALAGQRPVQCTFLEYSGRIVEIGWARPGDSPRGDDERPQR